MNFYKYPLSLNWQAIIAGVLCCSAYLYMAANSRHYGDFELTQLLSVSLFCALLSFWVWHIHHRQNQDINITVLLGFAIVFRIIGGFSFPVLEDDFYRYLWDARLTVEAGTPYSVAPATFFGEQNISEQFESILDGINYPYVETIYGPTCQWLFALAYLISPGEVWPIQALMGLIDLAVILILLKLAKPTSVLLYAWSPLIIKEFAVTAHPDVLGVMFILLAMLMLTRGRVISVGVCLALACGVKVFAIILLPFLLRFQWKAWLALLTTAFLIALPFGIKEAWLPDGLSAMGNDWLFNAPIYLLSQALLGKWVSIVAVKLVLVSALGIATISYLYHTLIKNNSDVIAHKELRADLLYAGLFLCSPVLNAWYLVWLLPFAVIRPSLWAWLCSVTILFSYASGINLNDSGLAPYELWGWVMTIEFMPPLLAGVWLFWHTYLRGKR